MCNNKIQGSTFKSLKYLAKHKFPKKLKIFGLQGKKQCKGEYKTGFKQYTEEGTIQKSTLGPTIRKKRRQILAQYNHSNYPAREMLEKT